MSFKTYLDKSGFVIDHSPRKPVQHPGSRGGKGYFTKRGVWEYGEPPEDRAAGIEAEAPPKETKTPVLELGDHIDHVKSRGYSIVDKTTGLSAEERRQTWQAVDDITSQVEKVLPQLDSVMSRQPLELIVESASQGNGVRGEHVRPLYKGDSNRIQINAEFPRTFVHELGHYLDSASAILHPSGIWDHRHVLSDMYNTPIFNTVAKIKSYPEYQQWISERPRNERPYWTRPSEIFARFFDTWANNQLGKTPSDSYEPFTPQEITEAGEILKQGLKKLDLIKSFLEKDYGQEPGWIEKLMKAMPTKPKPLIAVRPIKPVHNQLHEKDDDNEEEEEEEEGTLKSMLAYGIEPLYIQEMFKSIPVAPQIPKAPESEAQIQTGIGSKGGKYFIDKYGKKHYGPYGVQPPKKIKATEQPYLHEQAAVHPPEPQKPKTMDDLMQEFAKHPWTGHSELIKDYYDNNKDKIIADAMESKKNLLQHAIDIDTEFKKYGIPSPGLATITTNILSNIPQETVDKITESNRFRTATDPTDVLRTTLLTMGVSSIGSIRDDKLGEVIDKMLETAKQALRRPFTPEEESQVYSKYTNYLDKRIQDFQNAIASTKTFTHTDIQIGSMPAGIPPSDPDKLKGTHADAEQKIRDAHPENKTREDWKRFVARSVGQKMINLGITPEMCDEFFKATNTTARMPGADPRVSAADVLVNSWAVSADGNNALSLAVQRLTSEVFPGALKWDTKQPWNGDNGWKWAQTYIDNPVAKQVMTGFLYAQYENTQEYFKSLGIQELTIGRGCKTTHPTIIDQAQEASKQATRLGTDKWVTSGELQEDHYVTNPLSSWGWDHETNTNFAGGGGLPSSDQPGQSIVLGTRVPVSRILGGFFSGNGCENEHEVLLIGSEKPVDRMLWAAWKDTDYSTETETKVKVADALVKGEKPTTQNMNFITPEQQFTAELTDILKDIGTKDNWSKLSDADLLDKIQDNGSWGVAQSHIVMGSGKKGKISARDNTISNDKVLKIAHNLMDQGYGLTYKQLIDKNMAQIGHVWTEFYKQDEQADPGSFKENTADYLVSNFVQEGIIDQQDASEASEYLTQKVKEEVQKQGSVPSGLLKDKTPNKTVYNLTVNRLSTTSGIVKGLANAAGPVEVSDFVDNYLAPDIAKKLGLDKDDLADKPDFNQSVKDALIDEINKIKPGKIPVAGAQIKQPPAESDIKLNKLNKDLQYSIKSYTSWYHGNHHDDNPNPSEEEINTMATDLTKMFMTQQGITESTIKTKTVKEAMAEQLTNLWGPENVGGVKTTPKVDIDKLQNHVTDKLDSWGLHVENLSEQAGDAHNLSQIAKDLAQDFIYSGPSYLKNEQDHITKLVKQIILKEQSNKVNKPIPNSLIQKHIKKYLDPNTYQDMFTDSYNDELDPKEVTKDLLENVQYDLGIDPDIPSKSATQVQEAVTNAVDDAWKKYQESKKNAKP